MPEIKEKIIVKNLYKIFGNKPQKAMKLLEQGVPKSDIFDRIGQVAGVCDASFSEHEGEIFVVIRLSGYRVPVSRHCLDVR